MIFSWRAAFQAALDRQKPDSSWSAAFQSAFDSQKQDSSWRADTLVRPSIKGISCMGGQECPPSWCNILMIMF